MFITCTQGRKEAKSEVILTTYVKSFSLMNIKELDFLEDNGTISKKIGIRSSDRAIDVCFVVRLGDLWKKTLEKSNCSAEPIPENYFAEDLTGSDLHLLVASTADQHDSGGHISFLNIWLTLLIVAVAAAILS